MLTSAAMSPSRRLRLVRAVALSLFLGLAGCADRDHQIVVSVPEQRMVLLTRGEPTAAFPVSTSKFGLGDAPGSNGTPLGEMEVAKKIGAGAPLGAVFKGREPTGEVLAPDAPGRDPVVTRILWLRGVEERNRHTFDRYIYIHGTPEERNVGRPASFGCVRMRSRDVASLFDAVGNGARVYIENTPMPVAVLPHLRLEAGKTSDLISPPPPALAAAPISPTAPATGGNQPAPLAAGAARRTGGL